MSIPSSVQLHKAGKLATTREIYHKISLLPVLSQILLLNSNLIFVSTMSSGFLLLPASHDGSGMTFFVHRAEADSLPS